MALIHPLVAAAKTIKPVRQGDYDNLCGLYAILNAIRIVLWPDHQLSIKQVKLLIATGIDILDWAGTLAYVHRYGMPEPMWIDLTRQLLAKVREETGVVLERVSILGKVAKDDIAAAIAVIDEHTRQGSPALVVLYGRYDHYTVVRGVAGQRLLLFDSAGYRWVTVKDCDLHHRGATTPHQIGRKCAAIIRRCV